VVDDPILSPVRTRCEARVANSVGSVEHILAENAVFIVLTPVLCFHGIRSHKLKLSKTIIATVWAAGRVNQKGLIGGWVGQLF
jgi:hypothetical protein